MRRVPSGRTARRLAFGVLIATLGGVPALAPAQARPDLAQVESGVSPDTVGVGQPFRVVVRVTVVPGAIPFFGELVSLDDVTEEVEPLDLRADADGSAVGIYTLVRWVPGPGGELIIPLGVATAADTARFPVAVALPVVASVLPAELDGVEPRPAAGLLGYAAPEAGWPWWWLLLLLLGLALLGLLARRVLAGRRAAPPVHEVEGDPAGDAIRALLALAPAQPADVDRFCAAVAAILRRFLERRHGIGPEHTTTEVVQALRAAGSGDPERARQLESILHAADLVKFAGDRPPPESAERLRDDARAWVERGESAGAGGAEREAA